MGKIPMDRLILLTGVVIIVCLFAMAFRAHAEGANDRAVVGFADTRWFGDSEPVTDCSNDLRKTQLIDCLQQDRRVEVGIDYNRQVAQLP